MGETSYGQTHGNRKRNKQLLDKIKAIASQAVSPYTPERFNVALLLLLTLDS